MEQQEQNKRQGQQQRYLVEAQDGFLVSVPADKLESWKAAQKEAPHGLTREERQLKDKIVSSVYGSAK